jgi:hypothetical protein
VIGQRDEDRFEESGLGRSRSTQRNEPEGQLAEPDLAHQIGREVLTEQMDLVGGRRTE